MNKRNYPNEPLGVPVREYENTVAKVVKETFAPGTIADKLEPCPPMIELARSIARQASLDCVGIAPSPGGLVEQELDKYLTGARDEDVAVRAALSALRLSATPPQSPAAGDVERVARAISREIGQMGDTDAAEQQRVDHEWRHWKRHAEIAVAALSASPPSEGVELKKAIENALAEYKKAERYSPFGDDASMIIGHADNARDMLHAALARLAPQGD